MKIECIFDFCPVPRYNIEDLEMLLALRRRTFRVILSDDNWVVVQFMRVRTVRLPKKHLLDGVRIGYGKAAKIFKLEDFVVGDIWIPSTTFSREQKHYSATEWHAKIGAKKNIRCY